jgi:hypothetical protein
VPFELVKEEGEVSNTEKLNRGYESTPWASENHSYTLLQLPSKSDNRVGLRIAVKGDTRTRLRTENAEALSCIGRLSRAVFLTLDRLFWDIYSSPSPGTANGYCVHVLFDGLQEMEPEAGEACLWPSSHSLVQWIRRTISTEPERSDPGIAT